jgi:alkylhydroperoxidase family enzyme
MAELQCPRRIFSNEIRRSHTGNRLAASRRGSESAERAFGFVPNLLGVLAEAPIALKGYIDLTELLGKSSLNAVEQQVMMLAVSYENSCGYCMAAHSTVAGMIAMPENILKHYIARFCGKGPSLK